MSEAGKTAIDQIKIVTEMTEDKAVKQLAKILANYIKDTEKQEAGFVAGGKDDRQKKH
ncbi:MAG: hypothetical protein KGZ81_07205 [Flavobacteriales bacterium]|nr:hypothetical protein [Flavobacteriales bacterium]